MSCASLWSPTGKTLPSSFVPASSTVVCKYELSSQQETTNRADGSLSTVSLSALSPPWAPSGPRQLYAGVGRRNRGERAFLHRLKALAHQLTL